MPKAKASHFSRRKSHKIAVPEARDDANITFEEFKALAKVPMLTKFGLRKNIKTVYRPGDYARFYNVTLEGREDNVESYEYWVGEIREVRSGKSGSSAWLHVRWLWARDEVKDLVKTDVSHMGDWERTLCDSSSKSETVVHSDTIEGPTKVYVFDERTNHIPDFDAFYVRNKFNYAQKTLTGLDKDSECSCIQCGAAYNPDTSYEAPLRYCATCRVWCHTGCGKRKDRRLIPSPEFTNEQHFAKGLLLSGPAGDPARPGPKSRKAHSVAERAGNVKLGLVSQCVPKRILNSLVALAQTRIVRPLPGNIAGNKSYVLRAREWVREACTPGGLSRDRVKKLEEWYDELTGEIPIGDLVTPDNRKEAKRSALFVCNECSYPV